MTQEVTHLEEPMKPTHQNTPFLPAAILSITLVLSACTHTRAINEGKIKPTEPPPFQQTIKGYMAELGQYMDDVYRFWDSKTMHEVSCTAT